MFLIGVVMADNKLILTKLLCLDIFSPLKGGVLKSINTEIIL